MTLNRWDPLRDLLNFQERVNRFFDVALEESVARRPTAWRPAVDVLETPHTYVFRVELPGVGRDNINIEIIGNRLRIFGERPPESEPAIAAYHTIERTHGPFERIFTVPGLVDADGAEATYSDGLLEVIVPKAEQLRERRVSVVRPG